MSGAGRLAASVALCLLALPASFIVDNAFFGLVPIGCAVWLVAKAPWSRRARVIISVTLALATLTLFIVVLSQLDFS